MENYTSLELATVYSANVNNGSDPYADISGIDNFMFLQDQLNYQAYDEHLEIEPDSLQLIELLGQGRFGDVYLGILTEKNATVQSLVAVKTPKREAQLYEAPEEHEKALQRQRESLRNELKVMSFIGFHENLIKLLGAITKDRDDFCVLTEYCELGSLDALLRLKFEKNLFCDEIVATAGNQDDVNHTTLWKSQVDPTWQSGFEDRRKTGQITTSDLLWFALQIARAMDFLTKNRVLHRDIALRNVLIKENFVVKITDFGLSRFADNDGLYLTLNNVVLPFRYIAPESLITRTFTFESEYWAFGVVLWEIFTFAMRPPYELECHKSTDIQVILSYIQSGRRLSFSDYTPISTRNIMTQLWDDDPKKRPNFENCQKKFIDDMMVACPQILQKPSAPTVTAPSDTATSMNKSRWCTTPNSLFRKTLFVGFCAFVTVAITLILWYFVRPILRQRSSATELTRYIRGVPHASFCVDPVDENSVFTFDGNRISHINLKTEERTVLENSDQREFTARHVRSNSMHAVVRNSTTFILILLLEIGSLRIHLASYMRAENNISLVHDHMLGIRQTLSPNENDGLANSIVEDKDNGQLYCVIYWNLSISLFNKLTTFLSVSSMNISENGHISSEILVSKHGMQGKWQFPFIRFGSLYFYDILGSRQENFLRISLNDTKSRSISHVSRRPCNISHPILLNETEPSDGCYPILLNGTEPVPVGYPLSVNGKPLNVTFPISLDSTILFNVSFPISGTKTFNVSDLVDNVTLHFDTSATSTNQQWPQTDSVYFMPFFPVVQGENIFYTADVSRKPGSLFLNYVDWIEKDWKTVAFPFDVPGAFLTRTDAHGILEAEAKSTADGRLIFHGTCISEACTEKAYFLIVKIQDWIDSAAAQ